MIELLLIQILPPLVFAYLRAKLFMLQEFKVV